MAPASQSLDSAPRRHRIGSGFGWALDSHLPRRGSIRPARHGERERWALATWGEVDSTALGARLEPARRALLDAAGVREGGRLLDVSGGDGALAVAAAARAASVTALEPDAALAGRGQERCAVDRLPVRWLAEAPGRDEAGSYDAVVSCFAASHGADQRRLARLLTRAAAPGAPIALTAWKGLMATVMAISAPDRHGRSEDWSRHHIASAHFGDFPGLALRQHFMCWQFADERAALAELSAPVCSATGRRRLRDAMPDLIEMYGRRGGSGLTLRSDYVLVFARRP